MTHDSLGLQFNVCNDQTFLSRLQVIELHGKKVSNLAQRQCAVRVWGLFIF